MSFNVPESIKTRSYGVVGRLSPFKLLRQNTINWMFTNNRVYFSQCGGWKSEIKVPADSVSGSQAAVSPNGRWGEGALWGFFDKGTDSIHEGSPCKT